MKVAGWRTILLVLCCASAFYAATDIYLSHGGGPTTIIGQWGDTVAASSVPYHLEVLSIDPGHGADIAGVRPGDLIDFRPNTPLERFWLFGQPPTGRPVTFLDERGANGREATIVPQSTTPVRNLLLTPIFFGYLWIALFAAVIAWRRSDDVQMRTLCLLLVTYAIWEQTQDHFVTSTSLWVLVALATINSLGALAIALWTACAG
ncbi:MAG TPA: hypothetical protein VEJ20_08635, partial [Candidatus Eremiobacteraceae bacterium]|nr:hypothetical protein [Candidatus Eremiobacteraceae bacterium]